MNASQSDDVGVVVIGRNEGDRLIRCLQSLRSQAGAVVYVDSGSTDASVASAENLGAVVVRLATDIPFTAGRARNAGHERLREMSSVVRFVQFVDGDCQLDPDWIQKARAFLEINPSVAVVCGRRYELFPQASVYNWLCDVEWNTPIGEAASSGGDFLVRADIFQEVEGFRAELMAGEEPDLCYRIRTLGHKVWRLDAPMTGHDANIMSFGQWWRRTKRTGYGYTQVFHRSTGANPRLYSKEVLRATVWGGILPISILVGASWFAPVLLITAAYSIPLIRAASRRSFFDPSAWVYSGFLLIGKFAEFHGVLTYLFERTIKTPQTLIEYKST